MTVAIFTTISSYAYEALCIALMFCISLDFSRDRKLRETRFSSRKSLPTNFNDTSDLIIPNNVYWVQDDTKWK